MNTFQTEPRVVLQTNHGSYELRAEPWETVDEVLRRNLLPPSAVWTYRLGESGTPVFVSGKGRVEDNQGTIYARASRNVNFPALIGHEFRFGSNSDNPSTEWTFPSVDEGMYRRVDAQLSELECLAIVDDCVREVMEQASARGVTKIVVGVSGGGDSNVLLTSMATAAASCELELVPTMMLGIPDWDTQESTARQLTQSLGMDLRLVSAGEAAAFSGAKSIDRLISAYTKEFAEEDLEFLGTFMLRKVLSGVAAEVSAEAVAVGFNREDLLAESLARIAAGLLPLPMPIRDIENVAFVYPMWKIPKKVGDGAYAKHSLANYEARAASFSAGRSVFFYLANWIADVAPGADLDLLVGSAGLSSNDLQNYAFDDELGDLVCVGAVEPQSRIRWQRFLTNARA